jgi:hypothetical protein
VSLYFWSYTPWKIGFVASPETSLKKVFRVKTSQLLHKDPNSVRINVLVRVHSVVFFVQFSDLYKKHSMQGTLYKFAL